MNAEQLVWLSSVGSGEVHQARGYFNKLTPCGVIEMMKTKDQLADVHSKR